MGNLCVKSNRVYNKMSEAASTVEYRSKLKVVVLGDQTTGKSSILDRYVNNHFDAQQTPTIGIDFLGKNITHHNLPFRLQLWDTAGQERYRSLIPNYVKDAACAIFVFDMANSETIDGLQKWVLLFEDYRPKESITILFGNKKDLNRDFDRTKIEGLLSKYSMPFVQGSARTGQGVNQMFELVLSELAAETNLITRINTQYTQWLTDKPFLLTPNLPSAVFQSPANLDGPTIVKRRCC